MAKGNNKGLGRGLGQLFQDIEVNKEDAIEVVRLNDIATNPYQPRKRFDEAALEELKQSVQTFGILQPIIVRKKGLKYEIVAGERRYRAAKLAGLATISAVVKTLTDEQLMELALLENLQREDLTPIEEAAAYDRLLTDLKMTQEQLSERLGKSRSHIANTVRLLALPEAIQQYVMDGQLSAGHARALVGLKQKAQLKPLVDRVLAEQLNVRQLERLVQQANQELEATPKEKQKQPNVYYAASENLLRERFGTNVQVSKGKNKGKIEIEFYSDDDFNRILELLDVQFDD